MPRAARTVRWFLPLVVAVAGLAAPAARAGAVEASEHLLEVPIEELCAAAPPVVPFVDVAPGQPFRDHIRCLAHAGVTEGRDGGDRFAPRQFVSRAQMATFVARSIDVSKELEVAEGVLVGLPAAGTATPFVDVPRGSVHWGSIHRLRAAEVVLGTSDAVPADRFDPGAAVTRAQMASFVVRSLEHLVGEELGGGEPGQFPDVGSGPHAPAIDFLAELGIVLGDREERYRPDQPVRRDQMAAVLVRSLAVLQLSDLIDPLPD